MVSYMVGRDLLDRFPRKEHQPGEVMLELKNWSVVNPDNPDNPGIIDDPDDPNYNPGGQDPTQPTEPTEPVTPTEPTTPAISDDGGNAAGNVQTGQQGT